MSQPQSPKVTVRVEVVVEGDGTKVVTTEKGQKKLTALHSVTPYSIIFPLPASVGPQGDTPVYTVGGKFRVEASGNCPVSGGHLPCKVWAKAYNDPGVADDVFSGNPIYNSPPSDAVMDTPLASGNWSFSRAKGNSVPDSGYDSVTGGPDNSSLVVWYDYGGAPGCTGSSPPQYLNVDTTCYHGLLAPQGSGSGSRVAGLPVPSLTVTFLGSLAKHRSVALIPEEEHWKGNLPGGAGTVYLVRLGGDYHLLVTRPCGSVTATGAVTSRTPFVWCGEGVAADGPFKVTITE